MFLKTDLKGFDLKGLGEKFDVILIEPPLEVIDRKLFLFLSRLSSNLFRRNIFADRAALRATTSGTGMKF